MRHNNRNILGFIQRSDSIYSRTAVSPVTWSGRQRFAVPAATLDLVCPQSANTNSRGTQGEHLAGGIEQSCEIRCKPGRPRTQGNGSM